MGMIEFEKATFRYEKEENNVFENLTISLPAGIISLLGQNGSGKSTLLLLASASVVPNKGTVTIKGIDTRELRDEYQRQRYVSFIFQNMEFETGETIGALLPYVYENGFHANKEESFIKELIRVFQLEGVLKKKTQEVSKGELQRTILAFSLLYGSEILIMDEPIFAMEYYQKERALDFITSYVREKNLSLYFSLHELDLSEKYSDYFLLFSKERTMKLGRTKDLFKREIIEEAYQIPFHMLKIKEALYREMLTRVRRGN